ncbi:MAG: hypothetical protein AAGJ81_04275 [Verrucomicrobiota bacterium]
MIIETTVRLRSILILAICGLFVAGSHGEEESEVSFSFRTLFLDSPSREFTFLSEGEIRPFPIGFDLLSKRASYRGDGSLMIFSQEPNLEKDLEDQAVATVSFVRTDSMVTLICFDTGDKLECLKVDSDFGVFPKGTFCFINATADQVVGLLGEERISISPGSLFKAKAEDFDTRRVPIKMAYLDDAGEWRVFYSSKWTMLGEKRSFIIIYWDEQSRRLRARGVNFSD